RAWVCRGAGAGRRSPRRFRRSRRLPARRGATGSPTASLVGMRSNRTAREERRKENVGCGQVTSTNYIVSPRGRCGGPSRLRIPAAENFHPLIPRQLHPLGYLPRTAAVLRPSAPLSTSGG